MSFDRRAAAPRRAALWIVAFALPFAALALLAWPLALSGASPPGAPGAADVFSLERRADTLAVSTRSGPLLEYAFSGVPYKPYVRAFRSPRGANVLRDSPIDHKHHHALMYAIAAEDVSFWVEDETAGTQLHRGFEFLGCGRAGGVPAARFSESLAWLPPRSDEPVLLEERSVTVYDPAAFGASVLTWSTALRAGPGKASVKLGGAHYYGLGARFLVSMDASGRFLFPEAVPGEVVRGDETLTPGRWCAYAARADGEPVTVAAFDHPSNPRKALWFTMKTPFAYISATVNLWKEPMELAAGATLAFRYGFAVWDGEKDAAAVEALYRRWLEVAAAEVGAR